MLTEAIVVYCENKAKAIITLVGRNAELLKFKADNIVYVLIHVPSEDTSGY